MRRGGFKFAFIGWFITSYPTAAKALIVLGAIGLLVGMYMSAMKK